MCFLPPPQVCSYYIFGGGGRMGTGEMDCEGHLWALFTIKSAGNFTMACLAD